MSELDRHLSDEALLELCRIAPDHEEMTPELMADLQAVRSLVSFEQNHRDLRLEHAIALLTFALGQLSSHSVKHHPFGYDGPSVCSNGWVNRETIERTATQIVGMMWRTRTAEIVTAAIQQALSATIKLSFVEKRDYDAWEPGMKSGSGWRTALKTTPYGLDKARTLSRGAGVVLSWQIAAPTQQDKPKCDVAQDLQCYMYVPLEDRAAADSTTVFYKAKTRLIGDNLRRLFNYEYCTSDDRHPRFFLKPVNEVELDQQLLIDEVLEELETYQDSDPNSYATPPTWSKLRRAEFARRAKSWEERLLERSRTSAVGVLEGAAKQPPASVEDALKQLQHLTERHRLLFLYCARAKRNVRDGHSYRSETLDRDEYPDVKIAGTDVDENGEFLFSHRGTLNRYAERCIEHFGPGRGVRKTELRDGKYVEIRESSFPAWSLDEQGCAWLEHSSDLLLEGCKALARADTDHQHVSLIKKARDLAHDGSQSRWYSSIAISWDYLGCLDELVVSIKAAEIDLLEPQPPHRAVKEAADLQKMVTGISEEAPVNLSQILTAASTFAHVSSNLFGNYLSMWFDKPSIYDDRTKLNADARLAQKHGYLLVSVARKLSLDPEPFLRILSDDRLWEYPVEKKDGQLFMAAMRLAGKIETEALVACAAAKLDIEALRYGGVEKTEPAAASGSTGDAGGIQQNKAPDTAGNNMPAELGNAATPSAKSKDAYEWARQIEIVNATNQVLGEGELDRGVLSKACSNHAIATNGGTRRGVRVKVSSFLAWLEKKLGLGRHEVEQVRNAIIGEIRSRNSATSDD